MVTQTYLYCLSGFRQLCGDSDDRGRALHARPLRHGGPGGLRQATATLLPSDRCLPRLLQEDRQNISFNLEIPVARTHLYFIFPRLLSFFAISFNDYRTVDSPNSENQVRQK